MVEGWILLHRKLQECEIWSNSQPFDMRSAWVDLLLLANHKDVELIFDYKPMTVKRGQYLTSVRKLSSRWNWSKDRTLKYLRMLERLGMIHRESTNQRTLVTIDNYGIYQDMQDTDKDTGSYTGKDTGSYTGSPQTNNENNEKKYIYGDYKHVRLTKEQFDKLALDYGEQETLDAITFLDEYIEMKGYKAKNHNLALRKWVFDAVKESKQKRSSRPQQQPKQNKFSDGMETHGYDISALEEEVYGKP